MKDNDDSVYDEEQQGEENTPRDEEQENPKEDYYEPFGHRGRDSDEDEFSALPNRNPENIALVSLICGIASFACCGLPAGMAAILFALMAKRRMKRFNGASIGGLVLGIINIIYTIVVIVMAIFLFSYLEGIGDGAETTTNALLAYFLQ